MKQRGDGHWSGHRDITYAAVALLYRAADIFEAEAALSVVLEMPGVDKSNVDVSVEGGVLVVEGRVDFSKYEGMHPVYTEYNVGHYRRTFSLSNKIDQGAISAEMKDGVLTVTLPKAEAAKARRIEIG